MNLATFDFENSKPITIQSFGPLLDMKLLVAYEAATSEPLIIESV